MLVCPIQQGRERRIPFGNHRIAAYGYGKRRAAFCTLVDRRLNERIFQPERGQHRVLKVGPRQNGRKLITPEAGYHIARPAERCFQYIPKLLETGIPHGMAKGVIDGLEVIKIDEYHANGEFLPPRAPPLQLQLLIEEATVADSGQRIT